MYTGPFFGFGWPGHASMNFNALRQSIHASVQIRIRSIAYRDGHGNSHAVIADVQDHSAIRFTTRNIYQGFGENARMQASFVNLRLTGELLCGGAHDILTRRTRLCSSRLGDVCYGRGGVPVRWLEEGASRSWAERELTRMLIIAVFLNLMFPSMASAKTAPKNSFPPPGYRTRRLALSFELLSSRVPNDLRTISRQHRHLNQCSRRPMLSGRWAQWMAAFSVSRIC